MILGGGCGGLSVARALRFVDVQITLVDRQEAHLFQSKWYRAAVSQPQNLQANFARVLDGQKNVQLVQGDAVYLDAQQRRLILADRALQYDTLVVAAGSRPRYEREEWQASAPCLHSTDDAQRVREKLEDRDTAVVVVGGGVAGVELAAAVARVDRARRVVLVERGVRVLPSFPEKLAREAERQLERRGVEIRCGQHVVGMDGDSLRVSGDQGRERILSRAILWAGGVQGSRFAEVLRSQTGVPLDEAGRVCVRADLTIPGHPEIFVIGDLARVLDDGEPLDGLATVAAQQGRYVASAIRERMAGYDARPFEYLDQGRFAILGRGGIGVLGDAQLRGTSAWLASKLARQWSSPVDLLPRPRFYSATTGTAT